MDDELVGSSIWTLNISLSLAGKKSFGIVPNNINPNRGNDIEINMALLGMSKHQVKNSLYFLRMFLFLYPSSWTLIFAKKGIFSM